MRKLFLLMLLVGLGASSCKKYKLKQPAYLNFSWNFFGQPSGEHKPVIANGYFYVDKVNVYGARVEGPEVDIEQVLPVVKTSFESQGDLHLSVDIPMGDYTEFEVKLNVVKEDQFSLVLSGEYDFGSSGAITGMVPFRIEWKKPKALSFRPDADFSLDKKEDYKVTIGVNVEKLFEGMDYHDWLLCHISLENGVSTIVCTEEGEYNQKMFGFVNNNLPDALILTVEPQ
jgi:hypothetical protein